MMKWSWNESDCDNWNHGLFDTKEEAIKDAYGCKELIMGRVSCTDEQVIFIGQCEDVPLRTDVDADRILEYLDELYCEESGCDTYIYEGVKREDIYWLGQKLSDLMVEFHKKIGLKPCWFRVVSMESFVMR